MNLRHHLTCLVSCFCLYWASITPVFAQQTVAEREGNIMEQRQVEQQKRCEELGRQKAAREGAGDGTKYDCATLQQEDNRRRREKGFIMKERDKACNASKNSEALNKAGGQLTEEQKSAMGDPAENKKKCADLTKTLNEDYGDITLEGRETLHENVSTKKKGKSSSTAFEVSEVTIMTLMLLIAGVTAGYVLKTCMAYPSSWIFIGATVLTIGLEGWNWTMYKAASDKQTAAFKGDRYDKQLASFKAAEKQSQAAVKSANQRAMNFTLIGGLFLAASITSIIECIVVWTTCAGCVPIGARKPTPFETGMKALFAYFQNNIFNLDAFAKDSKSSPIAKTLKSVGATGAIILAIVVALGVEQRTTANTGVNGAIRAVIYAAYSIVAFTAAALTKKAAGDYKKRADSYKAIYNKVYQLQVTRAEIDPNAAGTATDLPPEELLLDPTDPVYIKRCFRGKDVAVAIPVECDKCQKANACKSFVVPNPTYKGFEVPKVVSALLEEGRAGANALYGNNRTEGARHSANVDKMKNAANKVLRKLVDKYNEKRRNDKKSEMNLDREIRLQKARMRKDLERAISSLPPAKKAQLDEMIEGTGMEDAGEEVPELKKPELAADKAPIKKMKIDDDWKPEKEEVVAAADDDTMSGEFVFENKEIHPGSKEDLFKIIHMRYLKSYPKLRDE